MFIIKNTKAIFKFKKFSFSNIGVNFGRKKTPLHFGNSLRNDDPADSVERKIDTETKGEDCKELNCLNLNPVKIYVGSEASMGTYIENTTNGCCGD